MEPNAKARVAQQGQYQTPEGARGQKGSDKSMDHNATAKGKGKGDKAKIAKGKGQRGGGKDAGAGGKAKGKKPSPTTQGKGEPGERANEELDL